MIEEEEEFFKFQEKLWQLINDTASPEDNKSNILMVSGVLLSACLKLYVSAIGKESTIGMFNVAIDSVKKEEDKRILH